ncbi:MAG: cellulose biosynthesis cyclic di-GMP-binding regulatory protein BcsB [Myxococcota bacterium]
MVLWQSLLTLALVGAPDRAVSGGEVLVPAVTVLRGGRASASFPLHAPERSRAGARSRASFRFDASEVVNPRASTLTVSVDGRPVRTVWLSDLMKGGDVLPLLADLGPISAGPHLATVAAKLVVDGDPCLLRHAEDAWVTLSTESSVQHYAPLPASSGGSWMQLEADWRAAGLVLDLPLELSPHAVLATIDAVQRLRRWGVKVTLTSPSEAVPTLSLRSLNDTDVARGLASVLRQAPGATRAVISRTAATVTVLARSPEDLPRAIAQLSSRRTRSMCPRRGPCLLTSSAEDLSNIATRVRNGASVLSLSDLGHPQGWTASGTGRHTLRFVWPRPATWTVEHRPQLRLSASISQHAQIDRQATAISVKLNDQPLASWHWDDEDGERTLAVLVPDYAWDDDAWVFDVVVELRADGARPCADVNDDVVWFKLGPDSALHVEREEALYAGVAGFFRATQRTRPLLEWRPPTRWRDVVTLATLLAPFADQTPGQRWAWVDGSTAPNVPRVRFPAESTPRGSAIRAERTREGSWWLDRSGELGIPLVDTAGSVLITHDGDGEAEVLTVHLGALVEASALPVPNYASLHGHNALFASGVWTSLGRDEHPGGTRVIRAEPEEAGERPVASTDSERAYRQLNLLWLVGAAFALAMLALALRRRPSSVRGLDLEAVRPDERGSS